MGPSTYPLLKCEQIVGIPEVDPGENCCLRKGVQNSVQQGEWMAILYGDLIQPSVINARMQRPLFLF